MHSELDKIEENVSGDVTSVESKIKTDSELIHEIHAILTDFKTLLEDVKPALENIAPELEKLKGSMIGRMLGL